MEKFSDRLKIYVRKNPEKPKTLLPVQCGNYYVAPKYSDIRDVGQGTTLVQQGKRIIDGTTGEQKDTLKTLAG